MTDFESVKYHSNGIDYYKFKNGLTAWVITEHEQDHPVRELGLTYSGSNGTGWRELIAIEPLSDSELNAWLKFISKNKPEDISKDD